MPDRRVLFPAAAAPPCADECGRIVREKLAALGAEATVSHLPPLFPTDYEALNMRCPHGVLWFAEPTPEQVAEWVRDEVA